MANDQGNCSSFLFSSVNPFHLWRVLKLSVCEQLRRVLQEPEHILWAESSGSYLLPCTIEAYLQLYIWVVHHTILNVQCFTFMY